MLVSLSSESPRKKENISPVFQQKLQKHGAIKDSALPRAKHSSLIKHMLNFGHTYSQWTMCVLDSQAQT